MNAFVRPIEICASHRHPRLETCTLDRVLWLLLTLCPQLNGGRDVSVSNQSLGLPRMTPEEASWGSPCPVAPYQRSPINEEHVIANLIFPLIGKCTWKASSYNSFRGDLYHTGIDIRAKKMTPIVAPFGGLLGMRPETFWIYSPLGWAVMGTHLNDDTPGTEDNLARPDFMFAPNLHPGAIVKEGQLIGYVGNSGDATGPHLHFELFAPPAEGERMLPAAGRIRNPGPSLRAAKVLTTPIPYMNPFLSLTSGEVRFDGCIRYANQATSTINLVLVGKIRYPNSQTAYAQPTFRSFKLTPGALAALKDWKALDIAPYKVITVICPNPPATGPIPVTRIILPESN